MLHLVGDRCTITRLPFLVLPRFLGQPLILPRRPQATTSNVSTVRSSLIHLFALRGIATRGGFFAGAGYELWRFYSLWWSYRVKLMVQLYLFDKAAPILLGVSVLWCTYRLPLYTQPEASCYRCWNLMLSGVSEIALLVAYTSLTKSRAGRGACRVASYFRNVSCLIASFGAAFRVTPSSCGKIKGFNLGLPGLHDPSLPLTQNHDLHLSPEVC